MHPTRSHSRRFPYLIFAVLVMVMAVTVALLLSNYLSADAATVISGVSVLTAGPFVPVIPRSVVDLERMSKPGSAKMRAFRAPLYDTQLYTSNSTIELAFFGSINADKSMSNLKGNGGTIPAGVYFEPLFMGVDILADASLAAASDETGLLDDIAKLIFTQRGFARITLGDVTLPEIPISFLHSSGGVVGQLAATLTAPNAIQVGHNGVQDGGYCIANSFVLSPGQPISVTLKWAAVAVLKSGNTNIRVWFDGNHHLPTA